MDGLEERGLIERRRNPGDRRHHALYLTTEGSQFMRTLGQVGSAHEDDICAALDPAERRELNQLLCRIASQQELTPGVHPGCAPGPARSARRARPSYGAAAAARASGRLIR